MAVRRINLFNLTPSNSFNLILRSRAERGVSKDGPYREDISRIRRHPSRRGLRPLLRMRAEPLA
jgi:hypothetical protein